MGVGAELSPEVRVVKDSGVAERGAISVDANGMPVWSIDELAPALEPTALFKIELKPEDDDVGKVLALNTSASLKAVDVITRGEVEVVGNVATTNLESDSVARGQGVVQR